MSIDVPPVTTFETISVRLHLSVDRKIYYTRHLSPDFDILVICVLRRVDVGLRSPRRPPVLDRHRCRLQHRRLRRGRPTRR